MKDCTEHGPACAYTGREVDRCPWCHATWAVILRAPRWHSCEVRFLWPGSVDRSAMVKAARQARKRAARTGA